MSELFQTSRTNVVEHIKHIYEEGELDEISNLSEFPTGSKSWNNGSTDETVCLLTRKRDGASVGIRCYAYLGSFTDGCRRKYGNGVFKHMSEYKPPFHTTDKITNLVAAISEQIGRIKVLSHGNLNPHLRKENRIRTIHSSLAIEHNSLSLEQVTAIVDGKHILGNPNEIREVKNAYDTYEMMLSLDPYSVKDLLKAHKMMMEGLIPENGKFRTAIFHYEFEFIHPFADGNGRMGRMWHSLLLGKWNEIFYWLPIEELIRFRQQEYYDALGKSDQESDSSTFVELMLEIILDTLRKTTVVGNADEAVKKKNPSVQKLLDVLGDEELSAAQIMERLDLSHRPTFRKNYLNPALAQGVIEMTIPDKPNSRNQRYRRKQLDR